MKSILKVLPIFGIKNVVGKEVSRITAKIRNQVKYLEAVVFYMNESAAAWKSWGEHTLSDIKTKAILLRDKIAEKKEAKIKAAEYQATLALKKVDNKEIAKSQKILAKSRDKRDKCDAEGDAAQMILNNLESEVAVLEELKRRFS